MLSTLGHPMPAVDSSWNIEVVCASEVAETGMILREDRCATDEDETSLIIG
jgi:hypothetical protein